MIARQLTFKETECSSPITFLFKHRIVNHTNFVNQLLKKKFK